MPVFAYRCRGCGARDEQLLDEPADELPCDCGASLYRVLVQTFSRHGSWSGTYSGYYDRGLGMYIEDYHHREKVMKDKGLRPAPDLRADDEQIDKLVSDKLAHEAQARTFHNKLNQTSSIAEAARAITPENI